MALLRSQTLEISAASVVFVSSVAAGLVGLLIGRFSKAGTVRRAPVRKVGRVESKPTARRPGWQSVTEVEEQLRSRDAELEDMRRNYELDTGLLKQEIRRLTESVAELGAGRTVASTEGPARSSTRETPATGASRRMEFASLEDLVGQSLSKPDRP